MRRAVAVCLSLLALTSGAAAPPSFSETQALTRAAPATATLGMALGGVKSFRLSVCAASGQTLTGAGTLDVWLYDSVDALWKLNTGLELAVDASGVRCQVFPDFPVDVSKDGTRVLPATNSVTVSGGTTVVVRISSCLYGATARGDC